jgi:hypothetical protein
MVSAQPRQGPRVQGHQNGLLKTDRHAAKLPIHLDRNAKCLDINAKDYCHLRHSNGMQTNPLLIPTTIGDSWPNADGLLWGVWAAKADVHLDVRLQRPPARRQLEAFPSGRRSPG